MTRQGLGLGVETKLYSVQPAEADLAVALALKEAMSYFSNHSALDWQIQHNAV